MDVILGSCRHAKRLQITALLTAFVVSSPASATSVTSPPQTAPYTLEAAADDLTVVSGTMQATDSSQYSVTIAPTNSVIGTKTILTINNGATLSYSGSGASPAAIGMNSTNTSNQDMVIENQGTISSGNATLAIYLRNSSASNNQKITINNDGVISGGILSSNLRSIGGAGTAIELNLDGTNANVIGPIDLSNISSSASTGSLLNIGSSSAASFSTSSTISNVGTIDVFGGSSFTLNNAASSIHTFNVRASGTATLNASLGGVGSDGNIVNAGTMNLYSNITKTAGFTTSGTNNVYRNISVATNTYANSGTHVAVMADALTIGAMTLSNATPSALANFTVTHTGGFLSAGTYTLFTANASITPNPTFTVPSNTNNVTFSNLQKNGSTIEITVARNGYQNQVSSNIAKVIGGNLESLGASSSLNSSMVTVLNAVEVLGSSSLESGLKELAPLSSAPVYAIEIQNQSIKQVETRLAQTRTEGYVAGDLTRENNIWLRPFGNYGDQDPKDDSQGYNANTAGLAVGFERKIDTGFSLGLAGSYSLSSVNDSRNKNSTTNVSSYLGMLYGTHNFASGVFLDWILAAGANTFDQKRSIGFANLTAEANGNSQQISMKGNWGRNIELFDVALFSPEVSAQYTFGKQYQYEETNAQGANLLVDRPNSNIVQFGLGARMAFPMQTSNQAIIIPEFYTKAFYNIIVGDQNTYFQFTQGGSQMVSNFTLSRSAVKLGGSLTFLSAKNVEVKLDCDYEVRDRYQGLSAYLNLKYLL